MKPYRIVFTSSGIQHLVTTTTWSTARLLYDALCTQFAFVAVYSRRTDACMLRQD